MLHSRRTKPPVGEGGAAERLVGPWGVRGDGHRGASSLLLFQLLPLSRSGAKWLMRGCIRTHARDPGSTL